MKNTVLSLVLLSLPVHAQDSQSLFDWGRSDVEARRASESTNAQRKITVAVIDTGVDVYHPDLAANLWTNPGETGLDAWGRDKSTNGLDDDGNGFIDDFHGWNFSSQNSDLTDSNGHGTHIAGIIAANGAMQGVAPHARLMVLKYYDPAATGLNNLSASIQAIEYAIRMKADIINYSGGGRFRSPLEEAILRKAQEAGILVVAAAGNDKSNCDVIKYYPANYPLNNILAVAATDENHQLLENSNYGSASIDLAAPGKSILSTLPGGYGKMTGTSQATAFASGAAALLLAERPQMAPSELIEALVQNGNHASALSKKLKSARIVNAYSSVQQVKSTRTSLRQIAQSGNAISVTPAAEQEP